MGNPLTVVQEEYSSEFFESQKNILDQKLYVEVLGQTPDLSYEDRDVFLDIRLSKANQDTHQFATWVNGEDAIELGMLLIKHGNRALLANMINHQLIHHKNALKEYISKRKVDGLILTMINDSPVNYGPGVKEFNVQPIWKKNPPKYNEDFNYNEVFYFSPLKKEFKKQMKSFGVPVNFVNYDHNETVKEFEKAMVDFQ